ncbi:hypothetical protein C8Q75DRAFT_314299 [Abortiporus biennis]|nr:hypothetical protein C8Q75DRAFT_314299 [Abortiporus biennis]
MLDSFWFGFRFTFLLLWAGFGLVRLGLRVPTSTQVRFRYGYDSTTHPHQGLIGERDQDLWKLDCTLSFTTPHRYPSPMRITSHIIGWQCFLIFYDHVHEAWGHWILLAQIQTQTQYM